MPIRRSFLLVSPKTSPEEVLGSLEVSNSSVSIDGSSTSNVLNQHLIRYSPQEVDTRTEKRDFTLTFSQGNGDIPWIPNGLVLFSREKYPVPVLSTSPIFVNNRWYWYKPIEETSLQDINTLLNWLNFETLESLPVGIELFVNEDADLYIYQNKSTIEGINSKEKHEFALVTEMDSGEVEVDRFVQGINGQSIDSIHPTMFVFSPFATSSGNVKVTIDQHSNAALHPIMEFQIQQFDKWDMKPSDLAISDSSECRLKIDLWIVKDFIIDKYEIQRLIDRGQSCISSFQVNEMDLELPNYKVDEWGSWGNFQIDPQCLASKNGSWSIPTHLRYTFPQEHMYWLLPPSVQVYWECLVNSETSVSISQSFFTDANRGFNHSQRRYYYNITEDINIYMPTIPKSATSSIDFMTALVVGVASLIILIRCLSFSRV